MDLIEEAFSELSPDLHQQYSLSVKYSGRFKAYNAHITKRNKELAIKMSKQWRTVNRDIKMGLVQTLLVKMLNLKTTTTNMDLYEIFLKNVHIAIPKDKNHPVLHSSFDRVNERYFSGMLERPNLVWGTESFRKLGSYTYGSDTISISKVLEDSDPLLLDYVMYHEMLHKKHKFHTKHGRSFHHTKAFRDSEKRFPDQEAMEKALEEHLRRRRRTRGKLRLFYNQKL